MSAKSRLQTFVKRFRGRTKKQIEALLLAEHLVTSGDRLAEAKRRCLAAGVAVDGTLLLAWADAAQKAGKRGIEERVCDEILASTSETPTNRKEATRRIRMCVANRGDYKEFKTRFGAPTDEELRLMVTMCVNSYHHKNHRRFLNRAAKQLNDRGILRKLLHRALQDGDEKFARSIARELGRDLTDREIRRIGKRLVENPTVHLEDITRFINANKMPEFAWEAIKDRLMAGWSEIRQFARSVGHEFTEGEYRYLIARLKDMDRIELLGTLRFKNPSCARKWKTALKETRASAIRSGDLSKARKVADLMALPLTFDELIQIADRRVCTGGIDTQFELAIHLAAGLVATELDGSPMPKAEAA